MAPVKKRFEDAYEATRARFREEPALRSVLTIHSKATARGAHAAAASGRLATPGLCIHAAGAPIPEADLDALAPVGLEPVAVSALHSRTRARAVLSGLGRGSGPVIQVGSYFTPFYWLGGAVRHGLGRRVRIEYVELFEGLRSLRFDGSFGQRLAEAWRVGGRKGLGLGFEAILHASMGRTVQVRPALDWPPETLAWIAAPTAVEAGPRLQDPVARLYLQPLESDFPRHREAVLSAYRFLFEALVGSGFRRIALCRHPRQSSADLQWHRTKIQEAGGTALDGPYCGSRTVHVAFTSSLLFSAPDGEHWIACDILLPERLRMPDAVADRIPHVTRPQDATALQRHLEEIPHG